jgi:hypothetical protein
MEKFALAHLIKSGTVNKFRSSFQSSSRVLKYPVCWNISILDGTQSSYHLSNVMERDITVSREWQTSPCYILKTWRWSSRWCPQPNAIVNFSNREFRNDETRNSFFVLFPISNINFAQLSQSSSFLPGSWKIWDYIHYCYPAASMMYV